MIVEMLVHVFFALPRFTPISKRVFYNIYMALVAKASDVLSVYGFCHTDEEQTFKLRA